MEQKKRGIIRRAGVGIAKGRVYSLGITSAYREVQRIGGKRGG